MKTIDLTTIVKEADGTTPYSFGVNNKQGENNGAIILSWQQIFIDVFRRVSSRTEDEKILVAGLNEKLVTATSTTQYSPSEVTLMKQALFSQPDIIYIQFKNICEA